MECTTCEGKGGYVTTHEGDADESCVDCNGTGERACDGCDNRATHCVTTNYKGKEGSWKAVQDFWCDECDTRSFIAAIRDE